MADSDERTPRSRGAEAAADAAAALVVSSLPGLLDAMGALADPAFVDSLTAAVEPVRLSAGETLFRAGDPSDAVYFVVTGRLLVLAETEQGETAIRHVGHGDLIGEIGLLEDTSRTATIRADRDSILARLPRAAFEQTARDRPDFLMGVTRTVVRRLAHPRPPIEAIGTVAVAAARPGLCDRGFMARLGRAVGPEATVVSRADIETALGPGALQAAPGDLEDLRLSGYLDAVEAESRYVLLEADSEPTGWTAAALRRADRLVVVTTPDPDPAEDATVRSFVDAALTGRRPEIWLAVLRSADADAPRRSAALAARYGADRVVHLQAGSGSDVDRLGRLASGTGTGLVLGGGGARGFAHIGVYRALTELEVPVDAVAGASIGGILGAAIALGLGPDEVTRTAAAGFRRVLDYTLPMVSMVKGARIARALDDAFAGCDIEDLVLPFLCVSSNLTTSRRVVHDSGPVITAARAGSAIPGVIPPVPHGGDLLVDGGVLDNLPIEPLRATGLVDTVIAVDVAPPAGPRARENFGLSVSGWAALRSKLGRHRKRYPGISALLLRSMIVGSMEQRDRQVAAGYADLVLAPNMRGISLLAFDDVEKVVRAGYEAAFPEIESWLRSRDER